MAKRADYWSQHLATIAAEGITTQDYAKREGLSVNTLYYWRRRLGSTVSRPSPTRSSRHFVAVQVSETSVSADCLLRIGPGVQLDLPHLPSPQWLAQLCSAYWHRNGFCLWYKRLEQERFAWPPAEARQPIHALTVKELEWLLEGFDLWAQQPHKALNYQAIS